MNALLLKIQTVFFALLIAIPIVSNAQDEKLGIDKEFEFDESSKKESFTLRVNKNTEKLIIDFNGNISQGRLKVDITDPYGNKISGFMLRTSRSIKSSCAGKSYSYSENESSSVSSGESSRSSSSSRSSRSSRSRSSSSSSSTGISETVEVSNQDSNVNVINNYIATTENTESDSKGARGVINKQIENPAAGVWEFTIRPEDASGKLIAKIIYK